MNTNEALATAGPIQRRHDLDWIRVLAVIALLFFHTGMLFVAEWDWHIQNQQRSNLFLEWMHFMSGWRMSLLFFVSGAGTYFALGMRSPRAYLRERGARLLIPLAFGMAVITPPQVYFERLFRGEISAGYFDFWPASLLTGPYPDGNLTWNHLWFVLYLFLFSVLALPLFRALRDGAWQGLNRFAQRRPLALTGITGALYAGVYALLTIPFPGPQNLINDWGRFCSYLILFVFGFLSLSHRGFGDAWFRSRRRALQAGFLMALVLYALRWNQIDWDWGMNPASIGYLVLRGLTGFAFTVAILGYARQSPAASDQLARMERLLAEMQRPERPDRIYVEHNDRGRFIGLDAVSHVASDRNYVEVVSREGRFRQRGSLHEIAARLDPSRFVQVNRSTIVNLDQIAEIQSWFRGDRLLILCDGSQIKLSKAYLQRSALLSRLLP